MTSGRQSAAGIGIFVVALVAVIWTGYQGAMRLLPYWGPVSGKGPPANAISSGTAPSDTRYDISQIVSAHIFGRVISPVKPARVKAPETKLHITLAGLITSADVVYSRAIIRVNGARMRPYAVGQRIKGTDATVYAVEKKRVLLKRGRALESLVLKRKLIGDQAGF